MKKNILFLISTFIFGVYLSAQIPAFDWAREMGGATIDRGKSIAIDGLGNVYTTGTFTGSADFDPGVGVVTLTSAGMEDIFIQKLDPIGNLVWAKSIGGTNNDEGLAIVASASGEVFVTGFFDQTVDFDPGAGNVPMTSAGYDDFFLLKLDASGNFAWVKTIGEVAYESGSAITLDGAGNIFVAGYYDNTADFDPGAGTANLTVVSADDVFILKLDAAGNYVWAKSIGGYYSEGVNSIDLDGNGNVLIAGVSNGQVDFDPGPGSYLINGLGMSDAYILKLDPSGNFIWAKTVGGSQFDHAYDMQTDASGNVYVCGYYYGASADFDPGSGTDIHTNAGFEDIFILKLDNNGNYRWAKTMGESASGEIAYALAVDDSANVYTTGYFYGTIDFDPGVGTTNLTSTGNDDIFMQKLDSSGNFVFAYKIGGTGVDATTALIIDTQGNLYSTGYSNATVDFDQGNGTNNLTSAGSDDAFIHKTGVTFDGVTETNNRIDFSLYPNPSNGTIALQFENTPDKIHVEISDLSGKLIKSEDFSQLSLITMQLDLVPGMYFATVSIDDEKSVRKIICR